jgi:Universal stress protein family
MTGTTYGIVAGYDGSPGAAQALRWAAREAWARGTTLTVCLAWTLDHMELPTESAPVRPGPAVRHSSLDRCWSAEPSEYMRGSLPFGRR